MEYPKMIYRENVLGLKKSEDMVRDIDFIVVRSIDEEKLLKDWVKGPNGLEIEKKYDDNIQIKPVVEHAEFAEKPRRGRPRKQG